jgi:hypothetical protein
MEPARVDAYRSMLERLEHVVTGGKLRRLEVARELAERWSGKSELVREELRLWARSWRELLLLKLGLTPEAELGALSGRVRLLAGRFSEADLRLALRVTIQAQSDLDQNVNPRLAIEVALLHLPRPGAAA